METIDFQRSFFTFRIDTLKKPPKTVSHKPPYSLNNARIPVDSRCVIIEKDTGISHTFILGVNCKTEQVGANENLFYQPNADFVPICSLDDNKFMALKTFDIADKGMMLYPPSLGKQSERQVIFSEETFDSLKVDLTPVPGNVLESPEEIVGAVLANRLINGCTRIESDRYTADIEYPIKTINANERDMVYQPDTGPVLLPDLSRTPDNLICGINLAFLAFNTPDWAEFIVRVPTAISEDLKVYHYSQAERFDAQNRIVELG
ncbi:MAG: hypothetical protein VYA69_01300 [Gemmatimonadota bacterium]|nr:hypothetical protein [Gemmatimonadota bacterium]